jgi:uncharacterized protein with ACT and thioredoxin-like domain
MTKGKVSEFTKQMFAKQYLPALSSAVVLSVADMADALVVGNRMGATGLAAIAFSIHFHDLQRYNALLWPGWRGLFFGQDVQGKRR